MSWPKKSVVPQGSMISSSNIDRYISEAASKCSCITGKPILICGAEIVAYARKYGFMLRFADGEIVPESGLRILSKHFVEVRDYDVGSVAVRFKYS